MYIQSDSHFNVVIELIDEIDEEQYVYSAKEHGSSKRSSEYMYERHIFQEKGIDDYYQGETFPIKGAAHQKTASSSPRTRSATSTTPS